MDPIPETREITPHAAIQPAKTNQIIIQSFVSLNKPSAVPTNSEAPNRPIPLISLFCTPSWRTASRLLQDGPHRPAERWDDVRITPAPLSPGWYRNLDRIWRHPGSALHNVGKTFRFPRAEWIVAKPAEASGSVVVAEHTNNTAVLAR